MTKGVVKNNVKKKSPREKHVGVVMEMSQCWPHLQIILGLKNMVIHNHDTKQTHTHLALMYTLTDF